MTRPGVNAEPAQEMTRRRETMEGAIRSALNLYGYIPLSLPIYEYYDLLKDTTYDFTDESIVRFIDRNTGKTLVLRPDFTPQVCRAVTGYMADYPLPLRIYYSGPVFRSVESHGGAKAEKYQIGWELFGGSEFCGDLEMLSSTHEALKSAGMEDCRFIIGDSMFLSRIIELAGPWGPEVRQAAAGKKKRDILKILEKSSLESSLKNLISALPLAFGGRETAFRLKKAAEFDSVLSKRMDYTLRVLEELEKLGLDDKKIVFDASETKGLDYYTGLNYEVVHPSCGASLGSGGRYDNLMAKFGKNIPACGMALKIDELMRFDICGDKGQVFDWLVTGSENMEKARELRKKGESVLFVADGSKAGEFIKTYRFKNLWNGGKS